MLVSIAVTSSLTKGRVSCLSYFVEEQFNDAFGSGGTFQSGVQSMTSCRDDCREASTCLGADWDASSARCYFHDASTECLPLGSRAGVVHFRFVDCVTRFASPSPPQSSSGISSLFYYILIDNVSSFFVLFVNCLGSRNSNPSLEDACKAVL